MQRQPSFAVDVLCVGHACYDLSMMVAQHPGPDEKCSATALAKGGGGPAANAAVAVARLGGRSAFAGYLGDDLYGNEHLDELRREGVRIDLVVRGRHPTPISLILVKPTGNRTVVNSRIGTPFLTANPVDLACCLPRIILFDGHEPLISPSLAKSARKRGVITVLDAGSVHRGTLELLPLIDHLVASERFALDFSGKDNLEKAFNAIKQQAPSVVVTCGERGLMGRNCGLESWLPAFPIEAADTTGAGDTFHGAFALELARGASFASALTFASAAAALACRCLGSRSGIPDRQEVERFLSQQGTLPIPARTDEPTL